MEGEQFVKLIKPEVLDSGLSDSGVVEGERFIFEEPDERPHFVFVVFGDGFFAKELFLFRLEELLLGEFVLFCRHYSKLFDSAQNNNLNYKRVFYPLSLIYSVNIIPLKSYVIKL